MKRWGQMVQEMLLLAAAPVGLTWLLEGCSRGDAWAFLSWAVSAPGSFALTLGMCLGLCLLFAVLRRYSLRWLLTTLAGTLCALLGIANRYKMRYRMESVLFSDALQLGDALTTVRQLDFSIDLREVVLTAVIAAIALILSLSLTRRKRQKRLLWLPLVGAAVILVSGSACTFDRVNARTRYDMVDLARSEGTLYTAVAAENNRRALMRVDYSQERVHDAYRALPCGEAGTERPNIILVLSESYTDEAWLRQYVSLTRELTPFYNQLVQSCQSGRLYVPKVGGGTSETEFEVLTGLRSRYAVNPYAMGLPPMNSVASILRDQGYAASCIHWYSGVYYNRYNNLRMLGFTDFFTTDTTTTAFEKKGMFVSDEEHYRSALSQLRRTEEKDFIFLLTMQNHGGYAYDDFRQTYGADTPFTNELSAETEKILANYCWLLEESDRALETFIHQLEALDEPTLLVFFGDHIAPLGGAAYQELNVDTGENGHLTPYFIWSSTGSEAQTRNLNAWQLGAEALKAAGLLEDPFLTSVLEMGENTETYDLLSYDALFGKQYAYDEAGLKPETQDFRIGGEMTLSGFDAAQIGDAIYLRPRLSIPDQAFDLCVNGQVYSTQWVYAGADELDIQCVMTGFGGARWNESNTLHYDSAQQLLDESGAWPYQTISPEGFVLQEGSALRACDIWKSKSPLAPRAQTALTLDGERLQWQPVYGLTRAGQYGVDEEGCLYVTTQRGVQVETAQLTLYVFE